MARLAHTLGLLLLTACGAGPQEGADPGSTARSALSALVEDDLPGVQYVVVGEHGVVFEAAMGVRDTSTGQPMQPQTQQMAYSMTKAITAIAAMKLVENGMMALDRSLDSYYPDHPYGRSVTIRSLLAQTSGVPNPMPLDWFELEGRSFDRDEKLRAVLRDNPELEHPAGAEYAYSNLSYWLLEKAIEKASGLDYADYVAKHVLEPAGVASEQAGFSLPKPGTMATGHSPRFTPESLFVSWMSPSEYWNGAEGSWSRTARVLPHGRGYGGLFTTASALAKVLEDLLRDESKLLGKEEKRLLFTRQKSEEGPIDMTLGWVIGDLHGVRYFGKPGGGLGFHGNLRVYPDERLATVLLSNRTELSAGPIDERSDELDAIFVESRRRKEPAGADGGGR